MVCGKPAAQPFRSLHSGVAHEHAGSPEACWFASASPAVFHSMCSGGGIDRVGASDGMAQPPAIGSVSDGRRKLGAHVGMECLHSADAGEHLADCRFPGAVFQSCLVGGFAHCFCSPGGGSCGDALCGDWVGPRTIAGYAFPDRLRCALGQPELALAMAGKAGEMSCPVCAPPVSPPRTAILRRAAMGRWVYGLRITVVVLAPDTPRPRPSAARICCRTLSQVPLRRCHDHGNCSLSQAFHALPLLPTCRYPGHRLARL